MEAPLALERRLQRRLELAHGHRALRLDLELGMLLADVGVLDDQVQRHRRPSPRPFADFEKLVFRIITLNQLVEAARSDFANSLHGISFLTERSLTTFLD